MSTQPALEAARPKLASPLPAYLFLGGLALLAFGLSLLLGAVAIPADALARLLLGLGAAQVPPTYAAILYNIRLPHAVLVALAGAALSGSGAAYQGLFRNPLADPYLIGAASGAGLGAVLVMATGLPSIYTPAGAFGGALLTVGLVYLLARPASTTTLILAGVALSSFAAALSSILMLRSQGELYRAIAWLMGGASASGWQPVWITLPYTLLGLAVLVASGHALNVLQFGDEQAQQLGLPVEKSRRVLIGAASLATAAAVAFTGVIGFIGLIVPHLIRLVWGSDYRRLTPLSILGGAAALLVADLLARVALAPQELPVGLVTALAGAPFFLWILRRSHSTRSQ